MYGSRSLLACFANSEVGRLNTTMNKNYSCRLFISKNSRKDKIPIDRNRDIQEEFQTVQETSSLYRLNKNYNPLQTTPEVTEGLGFGGIIIHGLFSGNMVVQIVLRRYGQQNEPVHIEVRLVSPIKLGNRLEILLYKISALNNSSLSTD
jgi:hypothetical protein